MAHGCDEYRKEKRLLNTFNTIANVFLVDPEYKMLQNAKTKEQR